MAATKLTPVLVVDSIEDALPFWSGRLGFRCTAEVPHGDRLGFVILQHQNVEVMLQSRASLGDDAPGIGVRGGSALLFVEVDDLDRVKAALGPDDEIVVPERTTSYGAHEIGVRAPGDHVVLFARFAPSGE